MIIKNLNSDPLKIIFEKHLFAGENQTLNELKETVLNYFFEYLGQAKFIIRKRDEDLVKDEVNHIIIDMIHNTIGNEKNIRLFLAKYKDLDQKKNETYEKYIQLYMILEESINL